MFLVIRLCQQACTAAVFVENWRIAKVYSGPQRVGPPYVKSGWGWWPVFATPHGLYLNTARMSCISISSHLFHREFSIERFNWSLRRWSWKSPCKKNPEQRPWTCGTYDAVMISGFLSVEGCTMPQFVVLFSTVARPDLCALRRPGDFLFSIADISEALLVPSGNIGSAMNRCVVVCWIQIVFLQLR